MKNLTTPEMAEELRTTVPALLTLRHRGMAPPAIRVGKKLLWPQDAYEGWKRDRLAAQEAA